MTFGFVVSRSNWRLRPSSCFSSFRQHHEFHSGARFVSQGDVRIPESVSFLEVLTLAPVASVRVVFALVLSLFELCCLPALVSLIVTFLLLPDLTLPEPLARVFLPFLAMILTLQAIPSALGHFTLTLATALLFSLASGLVILAPVELESQVTLKMSSESASRTSEADPQPISSAFESRLRIESEPP